MRIAGPILAALVLAVFAGCGGDREPSSASADASALEGVQWVLASGDGITIPDGVALTASFDGRDVAGSGGCNGFGGAYTVDGEQIEIGPLIATQRACIEDGVDAAERAYFDALDRADRWRIDEEALVLESGITEVLRYGLGTPEGEWTVTTLRRGDALSGPLEGTTLTAEFAADGTLSGSAGCNGFTGSYRVDGDRVTIPAPATTERMCATPAGVMEQEAAYVAALAGAVGFRLGGRTLTLVDDTGGELVALTAG